MYRNEFIQICRDRKFWQWVRSYAPKPYPNVPNKDKFLSDLFKKIANRTYYPNPPQEYITLNKGSGVLRIIPALTLEDLCIYYYCARKLERYIAVNRVPGTYGGFGLSGKLRQIEEEEFRNLQSHSEVIQLGEDQYVFSELNGYLTVSSLNPKAWFAEWNDFTKKLYFSSADYTEGFAAELDISNFYDSIQLDNLEYKLRKYVPHSCNDVIYLVCHFLRFWNRHINFYRQQGAGIPQDTFGECSRVLANFYLQAYDKRIFDFCEEKEAKFFRYADDQIIFAKSKKDLEEIIAKASSYLMREGLNFNQKKIKVMSVKQFRKYYAFNNFLQLSVKKGVLPSQSVLNSQINFYLQNRNSLKKGGVSLLRRLLNVLGKVKKKPRAFSKLKQYILTEFLYQNQLASRSDLDRIYQILNSREKRRMISILNQNIPNSWYTDYLYNVRGFYKANKIRTRQIGTRITFLRRFYGFEKV